MKVLPKGKLPKRKYTYTLHVKRIGGDVEFPISVDCNDDELVEMKAYRNSTDWVDYCNRNGLEVNAREEITTNK